MNRLDQIEQYKELKNTIRAKENQVLQWKQKALKIAGMDNEEALPSEINKVIESINHLEEEIIPLKQRLLTERIDLIEYAHSLQDIRFFKIMMHHFLDDNALKDVGQELSLSYDHTRKLSAKLKKIMRGSEKHE